ncbi:MAG: MBOAT family O-acyltransferase [Oscillospiraceae bacterium]
MNFISAGYIFFLACAAVLCYILKPKPRNIVLLALNYLFYALFGFWAVLYLITATLIMYTGARLVEREVFGKRRLWLVTALLLNLGMLFVFKYFNFFSGLLSEGLLLLGSSAEMPVLDLLLPVGISFYIFQTTGYIMDVYRKKIPAEKDIVDFALFASFFPGIVSGPISRAGDMLPQYKKPSVFNGNNIKEGSLQFLWGAFKKMVIADQLAIMVNAAYANPADFTGTQLLFAVLAYSVQIYCDFSAYSDMAIGSAKIMGFDLVQNFNCPYFATSTQDFWRRWHISLSTWFRDYLYFPLGGNRCSKAKNYFNIVVVFLVSGLWHGAGLGFIIWGLLHGLYQVIGKILAPMRDKIREGLHISNDNPILNLSRRIFVFLIVTFAWIFFRADSVETAALVIGKIFSEPFSGGAFTMLGLSMKEIPVVLFFALALFAADWAQSRFKLSKKLNRTYITRYAVYFVLIASITIFGYYGVGFNPMDFVYFKF